MEERFVMEGRWIVRVCEHGHLPSRGDAFGCTCWRRGDYPPVPVVPCDDAAIERAAAALESEQRRTEAGGPVDWRRVTVTAFRAAGETP